MNTQVEIISQERLDKYIDEAARVADYESGFGVAGCDLGENQWWAAYNRQSTREQAENDRLGEYLLSCARLAKQHGVIVPREYIIYDARSSEDMNRPGIIWVRNELIAGRLISGMVIPFQGRLSADPLHQLHFERECEYYGVTIIYGDAPAGNDWSSQTSRLVQAQANALRVKCNRDNALGGSIARVLAGKAPAQRAPYGYILKAERVIDQRNGRTRILSAVWVINEVGPDGQPVYRSPAWVVQQIFIWIGEQDRTAYWVAAKLNEMKIPPPQRDTWSPKTVIKIVNRRCYTGHGEYNANGRFPNPDRPLGDPTMGIKRTLIKPKPVTEKVTFTVPALTTEHLWQAANSNIKERGRGRGKQGKSIKALFRNRMLCPRCNKPMSVMRKDGADQVYYFCRAHYCPWIKNPCTYRRFIPSSWDTDIWQELRQLLDDDEWIESQLTVESSRFEDNRKLISIEENKIEQARQRLSRVQEGWEKGIYIAEEAGNKINEYRGTMARAEQEIVNLSRQSTEDSINPQALREELITLRNNNLANVTFEDRLELVSRLGIKVIPSEDLKSRRICCKLNLKNTEGKEEDNGLTKVTFGGRYCTIDRTFKLAFTLTR
jgi:DNA invertase Pin-like site-specific DNA recombinase